MSLKFELFFLLQMDDKDNTIIIRRGSHDRVFQKKGMLYVLFLYASLALWYQN